MQGIRGMVSKLYIICLHTHINIYICIKNTSILHIFSNMFFVLFFTCVLHSWEDGNNNPACFIMFHNLIYNEIKHLRNLARIYCVYIYMIHTYIYICTVYTYTYIYIRCVFVCVKCIRIGNDILGISCG